ncbi:MAG: hypothetical protein ACI4NI_02985 [Candidatus Ornithospirochaeta sp.]
MDKLIKNPYFFVGGCGNTSSSFEPFLLIFHVYVILCISGINDNLCSVAYKYEVAFQCRMWT